MKQKKNFLFLFLTIALYPNVAPENKIVIGSRHAGLFSNFLGCLNMLGWCEMENIKPVVYWATDFLYLQEGGYNGSLNGWEYYFEPISDLSYKNGDKVYAKYCPPSGMCINWRPRHQHDIDIYRNWAHALIKKYIKINSIVQKKIDDFEKSHFTNKKVIGLHLRGTDKKAEAAPVNPQLLFDAANAFKDCIYLVATDEQRLLGSVNEILSDPN